MIDLVASVSFRRQPNSSLMIFFIPESKTAYNLISMPGEDDQPEPNESCFGVDDVGLNSPTFVVSSVKVPQAILTSGAALKFTLHINPLCSYRHFLLSTVTRRL